GHGEPAAARSCRPGWGSRWPTYVREASLRSPHPDRGDIAEFDKALSVDQHGIEPIPAADRDSTAWQQFWIWFGANMSPLFWVAGAIGPQLGLSLVQSIVIMVVGQALGALIFGVFTLMGKRTGVSQF